LRVQHFRKIINRFILSDVVMTSYMNKTSITGMSILIRFNKTEEVSASESADISY
jgi:hypothetical protein